MAAADIFALIFILTSFALFFGAIAWAIEYRIKQKKTEDFEDRDN